VCVCDKYEESKHSFHFAIDVLLQIWCLHLHLTSCIYFVVQTFKWLFTTNCTRNGLQRRFILRHVVLLSIWALLLCLRLPLECKTQGKSSIHAFCAIWQGSSVLTYGNLVMTCLHTSISSAFHPYCLGLTIAPIMSNCKPNILYFHVEMDDQPACDLLWKTWPERRG
jgi:hypothetical protein